MAVLTNGVTNDSSESSSPFSRSLSPGLQLQAPSTGTCREGPGCSSPVYGFHHAESRSRLRPAWWLWHHSEAEGTRHITSHHLFLGACYRFWNLDILELTEQVKEAFIISFPDCRSQNTSSIKENILLPWWTSWLRDVIFWKWEKKKNSLYGGWQTNSADIGSP